jgi:putative ABC transport system substrate-binding protein
MDRRQFLLAVPCGALLPSLALAQEPGRVYRMAVISPSELAAEQVRNLQLPELARLGFVVGRNLTMTTHVGPPARMPELAREAIATKPDVVVAVSTVAILAVKEASSTVPIVMSFIGEDPIAKGLADSLARPGGSATGVAMLAAQMDGKRAALLHEFVPAARRIAILTGRPPRHAEGAEEAQRVARELGLETDVFYADEPADYVAAFAGMRTARSEALVIISAPDFFRDAVLLSRLALERLACRPCANGQAWHATAVSSATARTLLISGVAPQITSPEFCVVRSRGSCRSSNPPCSSKLLT